MTLRARGALLLAALLVVPTTLAACTDKAATPTSTVAFETLPGSTTTSVGGGTTTTTPPNLTYVVRRGDALTRIADDFCTNAADIVVLNSWTDGLQHVLLPGATILVPGPGCPVATSSTTSTTVVMNKYLALYVDEHVISDPFDPNTANHVNWGPVCYAAYWAAQAFATQGSDQTELMKSLDPLPGNVPSDVVTQIGKWAAFSAQWFPIYTEAVARVQAAHPMYPDTDTYYRALLEDPEYLGLLQAYEGMKDVQFAAKYYVSDLCTNLFATTNSTP